MAKLYRTVMVVLLVCALLAVATPAQEPEVTGAADSITVTLQQGSGGYSGSADTHIEQYSSTSNFCTASPFKVGYKLQFAGLVRFDLSSIPTEATIDSARLELYAAGWGGTNITIGAYAVLRQVTLCQTTWNQAQSANPWALPGGNDTTTDRRAVPESSLTTTGIGKWYSFALTSLVQEWVGGTLPNNGVMMRGDSTASAFHFNSNEFADISLRPKLILTYRIVPTPTPTLTATPTPTPTSTPTPTETPIGAPGTVILQQGSGGYSGSADTHIEQYAPTSNFCTASPFKVGYKLQFAGLVRFDLSSIPSGATIDSARLELYAAGWGGTNITIGAYAVLRQVSLCQTTWNQAQSGNPWATPGGNDTTTDRRAVPESSLTTTGIGKWYSFALTSLVQEWVSGSLPNNGVMMRGDSTASAFHFDSNEFADVSLRPKLIVTYRIIPTPTPTLTATPTPTPTKTPTPTETPIGAPGTVTLQQGSGGYWGSEDTHIEQYASTATSAPPVRSK